MGRRHSRIAREPEVLARHLGDRISNRLSEKWFGGPVNLLDMYTRVLRIRNRGSALVHLVANPAQQAFARRRTEQNIILKARQVGMTTYIAARFFLSTILRPGTVTLQVAHTLESAQQIFRIVHRFARHLHPAWARRMRISRSNVREISFEDIDSRYIVDTAGNRHAGRGLTVHNLHASEVALWPGQPQETMAALLAAVAPGGTIEIESTPNGVGTYFHQQWLRAQAGEGFTAHFFPWWVEPGYQLELLPGEGLEPLSDDERGLVEQHGLRPEQIKFRRQLRTRFGDRAPQEFAESDAECFLLSGRPVFDTHTIEVRLRELIPPARIAQNEAEAVWFEPQPGHSYVIGADVAEGTERGDYSAAVVIDNHSGLQCAELCARWPIARFAEELARMGRRYNTALVAVERNNQGFAVLHALNHQLAYPRIYQHPPAESGSTASPGWPMNAQTKPQAIGALGDMLRDAPGVFRSRRLLEQCRSYAYGDGEKMGARPGMHDDLVIAVGIALAVRAQGRGVRLLSAEL